MTKARYVLVCYLSTVTLLHTGLRGQNAGEQDSHKQQYLAELKAAGKSFANDFYPNYPAWYSLSEAAFVSRIDSVRRLFNNILTKYEPNLDKQYTANQQAEIKYYFDKLLIDYPLTHDIQTGSITNKPSTILQRLKGNLADFNNPELLRNSDLTEYVKAYFAYQAEQELKKPTYKNTDNQYLRATWKLIPQLISNPLCREYWQTDYLYNHIDNNGIKNIDAVYKSFMAACRDTSYRNKIRLIYKEDSLGRADHLIQTYKTVGPYKLDIHLFLPGSETAGSRPAIVYFHGGSWSEGKPDWFFDACKRYAQKGWVACAVEYRTHGRQHTLPFEAVMDARSAIRWLRKHAAEFQIDTNRIVASGNSAGGHLVLCTALADKWNEKTDDLKYSATPNVLLVNAGVYDLTDQNTAWLRRDLKQKDQAKEISPLYLLKKDIPPTLIIHGTNDRNVPFASAREFVSKMAALGNTTIEHHFLSGAGHFIWYDEKYAEEVGKLRTEFLSSLGY